MMGSEEVLREVKAQARRLIPGARVGVAVSSLETGEQFGWNQDVVFPGCSVVKVAILVELFRQYRQGIIDLDAPVTVTEDTGGQRGSGILKHLRLPVSLSVRNLATLMIIVSDNVASNCITDLVGREAVNASMRQLGRGGIILRRPFIGAAVTDLDQDNVCTAEAVCGLLADIHSGRACDQEAGRWMIDILSRQQFRSRIPRYLPKGTVVANKTGTQPVSVHDAGLVYPEEGAPFSLCVLCTQVEDRGRAEEFIARTAKIIHEYHTTGGGRR